MTKSDALHVASLGYRIRPPKPDDLGMVTNLLENDYARLDIKSPDPKERAERFIDPEAIGTRRVLVNLGSSAIEAATAIGDWRHGDQFPFSKLGIVSKIGLKVIDSLGFYKGVEGIFTFSAVEYGPGSPADTLFDQLIPPCTEYRVPIIDSDEESKQLFEEHGFEAIRNGHSQTYGDQVLYMSTH